MQSSELKKLIVQNKNDSALLIGNGINRYAQSGCSWITLLKALAKVYCSENNFEDIPQGISNTEFFDSLEIDVLNNTPVFNKEDFTLQKVNLSLPKINHKKLFEDIQTLSRANVAPMEVHSSKEEVESFAKATATFGSPDFEVVSTLCEIGNKAKPAIRNNLAKSISRLMEQWTPQPIHVGVSNFAKHYDMPILTTNYDNLLANAINAKFKNLGTDNVCEVHPLTCCYTTKRKPSTHTYGIWHINGMIRYPKSILIGLSHYMRAIEYVRDRILPPNKFDAELFQGLQWFGKRVANTWLEIIFRKNIFILGLALETDEVFLRWLLIERAKFYALYPNLKKTGWYIVSDNETISEGKKYFLTTTGFKIISVPDYSDIYNSISL